MRKNLLVVSVTLFALAACDSKEKRTGLTAEQRIAIADTIKREVVAAYDLKKPDVVGSFMSLYPIGGRVISASGGNITMTRADLEQQIRGFWDRVGRNMKNPHWDWVAMNFDVLSPTSAVMTAKYRIPHTDPHGVPHVIGGAWTAVFQKQSGRWVIVQEHLSDAINP